MPNMIRAQPSKRQYAGPNIPHQGGDPCIPRTCAAVPQYCPALFHPQNPLLDLVSSVSSKSKGTMSSLRDENSVKAEARTSQTRLDSDVSGVLFCVHTIL